MKKLFVCMVSVVMLAVLTACGNEVREDREQPARAENIAMSADMETDTGHDVQERGSDSIEAESEENAGRTLDDTAADSRSGEDGIQNLKWFVNSYRGRNEELRIGARVLLEAAMAA